MLTDPVMVMALDNELAAQPARPAFRPIRVADWPLLKAVAARHGYRAHAVPSQDGTGLATMFLTPDPG